MKNLYTTIAVICISFTAYSQCFMQVSCNWVTCFGNCDGTAQAYPVNMVAPISYQWMPGGQTTQVVTGLCAGTYTCIAVDSLGCTATAQCTVGSPAQLQAIFTSYQNASCQSCCDGYIIGSASGGTSPYTFLWSPTNQTTATAQSLCVGTYTLCVTDANGCSTCDTMSISFSSSVQDRNNSFDVNVWGTEGVFSLTTQFPTASASEIIVTNASGAIVWRQDFGKATNVSATIDLKNQALGLYLVSVVTESGTTTRRIVNQ